MSGDDLVFIADEYGIGKAEFPDAVGDLLNLFPGMGSGITGV